MKWLATIGVFLLVSAISAFGQDEGSVAADGGGDIVQPRIVEPRNGKRSLTRDEKLYLLEIQQANLDLDQANVEREKASVELEKVRALFDEKLETIEKLNGAQQEYGQAVVNHKKAQIELDKKRLEFLKGATLVTVVDATKYRNEDNETWVKITLRNDSDIGKARVAMLGDEKELDEEGLRALLNVDQVIVGLLGQVSLSSGRGGPTGRVFVCDPFQQKVEDLACGQKRELEYRLLKKDIEGLTVSLEFLGTRKHYDVYLKKDSTQDLPEISSTQYSQIGQLGSKIRYDLNLERLAKTDASFALVVLNLPQEIPFAFLDPSSKAILTQVKFSEELSKQGLYFEVSLPEKLKTELVDTSISFYIVVTHQSELKNIFKIKKAHENRIPPEEIGKLKGDKVELILTPRGVGKLEIIAPNAFKEVEQGEPIELKFRIINSGTLALRQVTPELSLPLEWEGELVPRKAAVIEAGAKKLFKVNISTPEDMSVGEYTVKVEAEGHSGVEIKEAQAKDFTIRVAAKSNITGTAVLVGLLVLLVVGIAIASIKISRR